MFSFSFSRLLAILSACALLSQVACSPIAEEFSGLDIKAREILERSTRVSAITSAPRWVVYSDKYVSGLTGPPPVSEVTVGSNLLFLALN